MYNASSNAQIELILLQPLIPEQSPLFSAVFNILIDRLLLYIIINIYLSIFIETTNNKSVTIIITVKGGKQQWLTHVRTRLLAAQARWIN